ncbi:MAG: 4Fe-4S dicluster domain-containing protein [Thermoguttaceae bacterium]|nr:4Fe-4S dicluster domain-containing protein [Thermoguttaceae bacterium]
MQNSPRPVRRLFRAATFRFLRWTRVALAAAVFVVLTLFFLDFAGFVPSQAVWLAKIQLIPSLLAGSFAVFAALVLSTLLFGRLYCSIVCPLGIFQDVAAFLARRFASVSYFFQKRKFAKAQRAEQAAANASDADDSKSKTPVKPPRKPSRDYRYRRNPLVFRAVFLALAVASIPLGLPFLALLEPYGLFGRIAVAVFNPVYSFGNNALEAVAKTFENYTFYRVDASPATWASFGVGVASFLILLVFARRYGRLYCNSICPVGTILGAISRFSFFKIRFDAEKCVGCGLCAKACKSSCVDVEKRRVDASRCVVCFDCLTVCRKDALSFVRNRKVELAPSAAQADANAPQTAAKSNVRPLDALLSSRESERVRREIASFDRGKRDFIALGVAATTVAVARSVFGADETPVSETAKSTESAPPAAPIEAAEPSALDKPADYGQTPFKREHPIAPPGAVSFEHFNKRCVGCWLCVSKCPSKVLKPATLEYGLRGFMQPRVVFSLEHFCNFDCVVCGEVCPAGAILPLKMEEKHLTQMGRVVFIKENCVVYARNENCGACSEHCPTQAVKMVPYGDPEVGLTIPETNVDLCVGCGACESICPALPYLAIYIDGNPVQLKAKPVPKEEVKEVKLDDFGF